MSCPTDEKLSAFLDGDVRFGRRRMERHVDGCARCTAVLTSLRAMQSALTSHPAVAVPDADAGWLLLATKLPATKPAKSVRRFAPVFVLTVSAAAVAVVLLVHRRGPSDAQLLSQANEEFRQAGEHYRRALDHLSTVTAGARAGWSPARQHAHDQAREALDRATQACAVAARAHPDDEEAEELLFDAYRKQIAFLQEELQRGGRP